MFERSDDPDRPFNTLVVVDGEGLRASYRKIHLYDSFGYKESDRLAAADPVPTVVDVAGVQVGLTTCYDLRFPELSRALARAGTDLLLVPAAWVAGPRKVAQWRALLVARAIENLAYVAGVSQPGPRYTGHSAVVDPRGEVVAAAEDGEAVVTAAVDLDVVHEARAENPSLLNRRDDARLVAGPPGRSSTSATGRGRRCLTGCRAGVASQRRRGPVRRAGRAISAVLHDLRVWMAVLAVTVTVLLAAQVSARCPRSSRTAQ